MFCVAFIVGMHSVMHKTIRNTQIRLHEREQSPSKETLRFHNSINYEFMLYIRIVGTFAI